MGSSEVREARQRGEGLPPRQLDAPRCSGATPVSTPWLPAQTGCCPRSPGPS
jgi:hypothetical protein